ncbi:hypothetical protein CYMTET_16414 [Cymbomonas tetramitiformis]|uniref:Uncharacterized protein n=1 Tax=Cymbomonas tetramitiformis TaxID=36881 RepID=A0AAE0L7Y9_9CHLO|nr:hypothetical protein CYMTET_16414 [Cymbomonas tetramitiformis]
MVERLLANGADPNKGNQWQIVKNKRILFTASQIAIQYSNAEVLALLLGSGLRADSGFESSNHDLVRAALKVYSFRKDGGRNVDGRKMEMLPEIAQNQPRVDEAAWECLRLVLDHTKDVNRYYADCTWFTTRSKGMPYNGYAVTNAVGCVFSHGPVASARAVLEAGGDPRGTCAWQLSPMNPGGSLMRPMEVEAALYA